LLIGKINITVKFKNEVNLLVFLFRLDVGTHSQPPSPKKVSSNNTMRMFQVSICININSEHLLIHPVRLG
jgi:hypothetical protein